MTNFAKEYPDNVSAMFLIKPFNEKTIKSEEFKDDIKWTYLKSKIESVGTYFGLTTLLDYCDSAYKVEVFEDSLTDYEKEEFDILKNKTSYRQAIKSELGNLYSYNLNSQVDKLVEGKPLYIISNDGNDSLTSLGGDSYVTVYKTKSKEEIISVTDEEAILNGVSNIIRELKKIDKNK